MKKTLIVILFAELLSLNAFAKPVLRCQGDQSQMGPVAPGTPSSSDSGTYSYPDSNFEIHPDIDKNYPSAVLKANIHGIIQVTVIATLEPGKESKIFATWDSGYVSGKELDLRLRKMDHNILYSGRISCAVTL